MAAALSMERLSRASVCQKFRRGQGETQFCSQERPREGQERSEPERHSQSWRCWGARWGFDMPVLEAQAVDQTPIRCWERGQEVKQTLNNLTLNMQHQCGVPLAVAREVLEGSLMRP